MLFVIEPLLFIASYTQVFKPLADHVLVSFELEMICLRFIMALPMVTSLAW
jgi:hypothetical protein